MKYSLILVGLLGISTLFASEDSQAALVQTKAELKIAKEETRMAKEEVSNSKLETTNAKIEASQAKAEAQEAKANAEKAQRDLAKANAIIDEQSEDLVKADEREKVLKANQKIHISVTGQGVAPMNTSSPAQAYALAKRAAIADAYRAIAEKVKGVRIDGQDLIKNMMVKRSTIRTSVNAMVRNANLVETTFKEGLCEVEMEIVIFHSDFAQ